MPPRVALILWLISLLALLRFDPAKEKHVSLALWLPLIWLFIVGSRLPSQWLGVDASDVATSQTFEEGSATDRAILASILLLSVVVLVSRNFNLGRFMTRNVFLMAFILFALSSVLWSDFPFISFKRWIRDLGDYLMVLLVLSDPDPLEAVRTVFRRLFYLLIPLSILLVKYFPQIGKMYEFWSGAPMFVGASTSKNMLGVVCLVSGTYFFWDTVARWADRKERRTKWVIRLNVVFIGMTLWLLNLSNSATSRVCLAIGCLVIAAAHTKAGKRNPTFLKILAPMSLSIYMILEYGFGINGQLAGMVGRNSTLTGRTELWKLLLGMNTNPLVGTGYESFWLGTRLEWIWRNFTYVNEAHNGYLEMYLNLGIIGLSLLLFFLIASYRDVCKALDSGASLASLSLGLWTVLLFYNVTEAAFRSSQLMWLAFLVLALSIHGWTEQPVRNAAAKEAAGVPKRFRPVLPMNPTSARR